MDVLVGPFAILALVVAVGGASKVHSPQGTTAALSAAGLRVGDAGSRLLGLAELAIGAAALAYGGWLTALLVAAAYLGFAAFVEVALRNGQGSCGCFGRTDTPPTRLHTIVDLVAAGIAVGAVAVDIAPLVDVLGEQPWSGVPFLAFVVLGATLVTALLALLPAVLSAPSPAVAAFRVDADR